MPALPVRQDHDARERLADYGRNLQPVLPCVLHATVRNAEGPTPTYTQDSGGIIRFTGAIVGSAARAHLAWGQVEHAGAVSKLSHLEQRATTGLLHVVAVSGDGEDIKRLTGGK